MSVGFENNPAGDVLHADVSLSLAQHGFVGDSIVDGPGLRCALFCQGCPHHCPGCHNPETHPFEGGTMVSLQTVQNRIHRYPLCHAVTFSGGEPFSQAKALVPLAQTLKNEGYELAAYTGYTFEELLAEGTAAQKQFLCLLDTLIDGPFLASCKDLSLRFRGSSNQRILCVQKSLSAQKAVLETEARWVGTQANAPLATL